MLQPPLKPPTCEPDQLLAGCAGLSRRPHRRPRRGGLRSRLNGNLGGKNRARHL